MRAGRGIRCSKDHPGPKPSRTLCAAVQRPRRLYAGDGVKCHPRTGKWSERVGEETVDPLDGHRAAVGTWRREVRIPTRKMPRTSKFRRVQASRLDFAGGIAPGGVAWATGSVPRRAQRPSRGPARVAVVGPRAGRARGVTHSVPVAPVRRCDGVRVNIRAHKDIRSEYGGRTVAYGREACDRSTP